MRTQMNHKNQSSDIFPLFDIFWNNTGLRGSIWNDLVGVVNPSPLVKTQKFSDFQNKVNSTNSILFNFIDIK
ncbi:MAG: hypothetical protein IPH28_09455 [Cytophagaceae bacterium]|nr:hypothetical protein [Cytophagaceae bacterium]MBK9933183.1 hypothetical protein [Cytophagaceae bacterium]MBL0303098.1 hypothetical protein [Cytophagaceae bacterium]